MYFDRGDILRLVTYKSIYSFAPLYQYVVVLGYRNYKNPIFNVGKREYCKVCMEKVSMYIYTFYASTEEQLDTMTLTNSLSKLFMKPLEKMPSTVAIKDLDGYTKINGNYKEEVNEWLLKSKLVGSNNLKNGIDAVLDLQKYMSLSKSRYDDYYKKVPNNIWSSLQEVTKIVPMNIYIFDENDTFSLYFVLSYIENSRIDFWVTLLCTEREETFNRKNFAYALAVFLNNGGANNNNLDYDTFNLNSFHGKIYLASL